MTEHEVVILLWRIGVFVQLSAIGFLVRWSPDFDHQTEVI